MVSHVSWNVTLTLGFMRTGQGENPPFSIVKSGKNMIPKITLSLYGK